MSKVFPAAFLLTALTAAPAFAADSYSQVYEFQGGTDGSFPKAGLTNVGGTLYGTAELGGSGGEGTVFSLTTGGTVTVLYSFTTTGKDGRYPESRLIYSAGALYGTTYYGGAKNIGTVFKVTLRGAETVLHSFAGSDGKYPATGLLNEGGTLYGTASQGGSAAKGVVFAMTESGAETVLHSFLGNDDGSQPHSALIDLGGTLYGTTYTGAGAQTCTSRCGSVYSITLSGNETVLHAFQRGGTDGAWPLGALLNIDGALYGTTYEGGANDTGTIYSITPAGAEQLVYSFSAQGSPLAAYPTAGLLKIGNAFYGVTVASKTGGGAVYKVLPNGTMKVLHYFAGGSDGYTPVGELVNVSGTLYGVTSLGGGTGCGGQGCGTIFKITR